MTPSERANQVATVGDNGPPPSKGFAGSLMPHAAFGPVQGPGGLIVFGFISFGDRCQRGSLTTVRGRGQEQEELTKRSSYKMRLLVKL